MDPEKALHSLWPDLDPNCLTLKAFMKEVSKNRFLRKNLQTAKWHKNSHGAKSLNNFILV